MRKVNELMKTPLLTGENVSKIMIDEGMVYRDRASTTMLSKLLYCTPRNAQKIIRHGFKDSGTQALFYLQMKIACSDK
ncbi:TPA: hypothetical protein ACGSUT_004867 [Vibrio parahaemolyticus]|uniref:hypothetical protein n=1 Tax=Vibrio harveyi group TaxID=717610 RepID=UPI001B81E34A|nr:MULTISPECIES: hypothetical protein [Vibrio harveyi group]MCR9880973.1 hypothetical protein [Vibrio parahaemolyticus]MCR9896604.1 hypothetical protein [Vibrio parahaemolyticus]MCZ6398801.1 hypothetical protein [Vibrio alginolyticus]HBC3402624.1 hypothetical protein [Vibrio parahaemolyticus]HBH7870928.1 hypothetical protein [Vibrio parahaemolyticus]